MKKKNKVVPFSAKTITVTVILIVTIAACKQTSIQTLSPTSTVANGWYTPAQYRDSLGVGVDVDWANNDPGIAAYNVQAVKDFKAKGVSHVRLRMRYEISTTLLNHIDRIVKDCIDYNLIPVIAFQADTLKNYPFTPGVLENAVNWWKSISEKLKNYPTRLSFDLMVECSDSLNNYPARLNEYFEKAVIEIRRTNPNRIIMISPRKLSAPEFLVDLQIPTQHNNYLMVEWHMYAAGPSKTNVNKLWTTGTSAEKALITNKIDIAYNWQIAKNIPIWVGAWMPGDYNDGDNYSIAEQIAFSGFMSCQLKQKGIPHAVNSDTKFYDRDLNIWTTRLPVLQTVINPPNCP
jgi:hypothetical protein